MKKLLTLVMVAGMSAFLFHAACGGGTPDPTTAVLTLSSAGTLPTGVKIGGIDMTIVIPAGATIQTTKANTSKMVTYSGAVVPAGVAAGPNAITLATNPAPDQVVVKLANADGFGIGEFATVTCDIVAGSTVVEKDFIAGSFSVVDLNGAPITGLTVELSVVLQ